MWHTSVAKAAFAIRLYRAIDWTAVSSVVVATQHELMVRSLILAAQEAGKPVVYLPHAPIGSNAQYADLPTAFAGLRGRREVDYCAQHLNADAELLDVVGNPSSDVLSAPMPAIDTAGPGVLALSPHPPRLLRAIVDAVRESGVKHLIVAPHPRSNLAEISKLVPKGWSVHAGRRTLDLLREGPRFLLHHSSGVAWESAALGIPTADVSVGGARPNYPFLEDPVFPRLQNSGEIADFVLGGGSEATDRELLRVSAMAWCAIDGEAAARRVREVVAEAEARFRGGRPARLVDGWAGADSPAREISWLPAVPADWS